MTAAIIGVYRARSRNHPPLQQQQQQQRQQHQQQQQQENNTVNHTRTHANSPVFLEKASNSSAVSNAAETSTLLSKSRPLRSPLQSRNHNAMMRGSQKGATPLKAKSGNSNMPSYDNKHNASRPLMPTLSAAAKASNRPPLTPRVAGSTFSTVSTPLPLSRRAGQRSIIDSTTPNSTKDDLSAQVSSAFLNNVTPRSGPRKVRVDSANTTPTGTPNGTPIYEREDHFRAAQDATIQGSGMGISGMDRDMPKRPTVSFNTTASDVGGIGRSNAAPPDSKFFFASDAKPAPPSKLMLQPKSSSAFFYANGESIPPPPQISSGSAVGSAMGDDRSQPKFFRANGTPDIQLSPSPHFAPSRPSSVLSNSSHMTSSRTALSGSGTSPRPISPEKLSQYPSIPSLRNTPTPSLPSPALSRPQAGGRGQSANTLVAARKVSIEVKKSTHGRSSSMTSNGGLSYRRVSGENQASTINEGVSSRRVSGESQIEQVPPMTPLSLAIAGLASAQKEATAETLDSDYNDEFSKLPTSPIKTIQTIETLNELAANARRERKVLDLEITNSSLAAINKTLEREMRKQNAELRRYRRLSRSGRLSIASSSLRAPSESLSMIDSLPEGQSPSDMSEGDEEEEDDEINFSEDSDSMDDGSLSPAAMAESDLRHRKRDEKRLQLDLSKHQQLLIDSQKINLSLKRCLGWTEVLISEGKKALEYNVKVGDVELGGKVLTPDEIEDAEAEAEADNEGMSDIGARMLREARRKAAASGGIPWGAEGKDDRDSGIEIDGSQRDKTEGPF